MATQVELAFKRLLRAYNKKESRWIKRKGKNYATKGWTLYGAYGGWQVQEVVTSGGGVRNLFDSRFRSRGEFVRWVDTLISAKRQK